MLRKNVSFGNLGQGPLTKNHKTYGDSVTDLYAPMTKDGYTNGSFVTNSNSQWVRLFVDWNFCWPNPPSAPANPKTTPYSAPLATPGKNQAQVAAQFEDLNRNINYAKRKGRKVILTTDFFPKWVNGQDPGSTSETAVYPPNGVMPADNALMLPTSTPPNGTQFEPSDFMYFLWIYTLMYLYHPSNPSRPFQAQGASIDALELVNEPNLYTPSTSGTALSHSTAVMMHTAQYVKSYFNTGYQAYYQKNKLPGFSPLFLLGPATAEATNRQGQTWQSFVTDVIAAMLSLYPYGSAVMDRDFGWSHHNYPDVENIGIKFRHVKDVLDAEGLLIPPATIERMIKTIAPKLYGKGTQQCRALLGTQWQGWGQTSDPGDADPTIFLTEGGCRMYTMPQFTKPRSATYPHGAGNQANPTYDAKGKITRNPAVYQRELQRISVGGAADALQQRGGIGQGIEMLTNFLFFDNPGAYSGLCDRYTGARVPPSSQKLTAAEYERPSYSAWKKFGL